MGYMGDVTYIKEDLSQMMLNIWKQKLCLTLQVEPCSSACQPREG